MMSRHQSIERKLQAALSPLHLEVIDESHMHSVPEGAQSHFKVIVVSDAFDGEKLIARHRRINAVLKEELDAGMHALALHTLTPQEWFDRGGSVEDSPLCLGGSKKG